jgi:hypothetical protein
MTNFADSLITSVARYSDRMAIRHHDHAISYREVQCRGARPGSKATSERPREFVKGHVAPYKHAGYAGLVDEFPKAATRKVLRREVRSPEVVL